MRLPLVLAAALVAAGAAPGDALTLLSKGKVVTFRADKRTAVLRVGRDRALTALIDPTCPAASSVQVGSYPQATTRLELQPLVQLDCTKWRAVDGGFQYTDKPGSRGGVQKIVYTSRKLLVRIAGDGYVHVPGPVGYVEMWLGIGAERFLARFHNFRRNDAAMLATRKPSAAAADGETAFWDVLWGDDASAARQQQTIDLLTRAVKQSPKDGRSRFLLGMIHLYRFGNLTSDYTNASEAAKVEIHAAYDAFQAAVPLLWDGTAGDSRVPGFAAAAKYTLGVVEGDASLRAEGLADLDAAVLVNPIFNLFDYIGVVPSTVLPTDPLYPRVVEILDFALAPENASCFTSQPEVCGNAGMAPHNVEGSFTLFGDLYAKGGILSDPTPGSLRGAQTLYTLAQTFANVFGWKPAFKALIADRAANVAARIALYQNADPADDPILIGNTPGEPCATCHHKQ
jgi:hypothetical protein